ncbi:hypothetical protein N9Y79_00720 [Alphaproteobacteria bacterium]|nr:hypothetical protein [Alphaproteobacteria bacterium]
MIRTLIALSICALTLAACGGGNSGGNRVGGGTDTGGRIESAIKSNRIVVPQTPTTPAPKSSHANAAAALKQDPSSKRMIVPISDDDAYHANMLFIFAAGNNGQECFGGIGDCNLLAAAIDSMRQDDGEKDAGKRVLFVGALSDDSFGTDRKSLARYSHPAGDMVNDFIVAHDDIFEAGIVRSSSGTSYAAPGVAGAAKRRQSA